jgi:hypothetical protein
LNDSIRFNAEQSGWRRILQILSLFAVSAFLASAISGCGGSNNNNDDDDVIVDPPEAPTGFTVIRTPETVLSATLGWTAPLTGGDPSSFEIYRSTTVGTAFQDANQVISIPAVAGKTDYTFVDNTGLTPVETYWVVSAKNAGGEAPTAEVMFKPIGPPPGGGDEGFGNNFAAAMIFADNIGIGGEATIGTWTTDLTSIDRTLGTGTGLRPTVEDLVYLDSLTPTPTLLPYLDPATTYTLDNVTYYKQKTPSTWQGQWEDGAATPQNVTAKWGDNLISQRLTTNSVIRIEMVLSKALTTPMTSYWMESLYGTKENEVYGTDGTTEDTFSAFVFASNARLKIQKLDGSGNTDGPTLYDQTLWNGDGPGFLAGEINVAGNFTYGFVWNLKNETLPPGITTGKAGTWRITFILDPDNSTAGKPVPAASNNTFIDTAVNGVRVSNTEAYIDIVVQ